MKNEKETSLVVPFHLPNIMRRAIHRVSKNLPASGKSMRQLTAISLLGISLLFVACGKKEESKPAAPEPPFLVGKLKLDNTISSAQRAELVNAYNSLDSSPMRSPEPELLRIMKLNDASASSIRGWIEDRVQYIVGESFNLEDRASPDNRNFTYENPGVFPSVFEELRRSNETISAQTQNMIVMSNVGVALYAIGKKNRHLVNLSIDGVGAIPLTSPRVGVLQIGAAFSEITKAADPLVAQSYHISTLVHESRHSDGNGKSLGFLHEKCSSGDYAGRHACDKASNGAYKLDALVTRSYLRSCVSCTPRQTQILKIIYLDSESRVLPGAVEFDAQPEGRR